MTKAAELAKMGEVLTNSQIGGRRNIVINGGMQVAQRGTTTGQGGAEAFDAGADMGADMGAGMGGEEDFSMDASEELPAGGEEEVDLNMDVEEPEDLGSVGRAKR